MSVIENIPRYFAQRQPKELSQIKWIVDAKDTTKKLIGNIGGLGVRVLS